MDYRSFAPGALNNNPTPPPVLLPEGPKHLPKLVTLVVLFLSLGLASYAGILYWQEQKLGEDYTVQFTPRIDPTADWKTYTNVSLGFSVQYPLNLVPTLELNDQYNRLTSFGSSKTNTTFEVRLQKDTDSDLGIRYGFLGAKVISSNIKLGGIVGFQAVSTTGYCDGPGCGKPYVVFATRYGGDVYHLIFYGNTTVSTEENQILSTFKFTDSVDTSTWKTYTNTQYGFEFKYPPYSEVNLMEDRMIDQGYTSWRFDGPGIVGVHLFIYKKGYEKEGCYGNTIFKTIFLNDGKAIPICLGYILGDKRLPSYYSDIPFGDTGTYGEFQSSSTAADEDSLSEQFLEQILSTFKFIDNISDDVPGSGAVFPFEPDIGIPEP